MSSSISMSQSMKIAQPSKPQSHGVRKRENENSVDCSGFALAAIDARELREHHRRDRRPAARRARGSSARAR